MTIRLTLACLVLLAGCAKPHPVQPTPASWTLPPAFAHCKAEETITWPNHVKTVVVRCPERYLFLSPFTKLEISQDELDFRRSHGTQVPK